MWRGIRSSSALVALALFCFSSCGSSENKEKVYHQSLPADMKSPESIKAEHTELHHQLEQAMKLSGSTGKVAKEVADLLQPHFEKEEAFATPPLTLLPQLARGEVTDEMEDYIPLTDTLKKNWSSMLQEHKAIKEKLDLLKRAATDENHEGVVKFAEALSMHARTEEEILYPAAILVGDYLILKRGNR